MIYRFDAAPSENTLNESTSARYASANPGSAKNMRMSAIYSPKVAAAAAPDLQSSDLRAAFSLARSKTKSQEVFDESGNAIPLEKNLPPPSAFSAQLLQGKFMQHPDGTIVKKRPSMYSASTLNPR